MEQRRFSPTELGFIVNDKLVQHFPDVINVQFTAGVEEKLDEVEEGRQNWVTVLRDWYTPFSADIARAKTEMEKVEPVETDFDCPACNAKMLLRRGRFGAFYACSNYPDCKTSMNVGADGEPIAREEKVAPVIEGIEPGATKPCEKCGKDMVVRVSRIGAFWGCTGYPKCKNLVPIEGASVPQPEVQLSEHMCPNCGKPLAQRKGRFGPFLGCTGYPECKTIVNLDKDGNPRTPRPRTEADEIKDLAKAKGKPATKKTAAKKPAAKAAPKKRVAKVA